MGIAAGGGTSQQQSRPPRSSFLNPVGGVLANLFGIGTQVGRQSGGLELTGPLQQPRRFNFFTPPPGGGFLGAGGGGQGQQVSTGNRLFDALINQPNLPADQRAAALQQVGITPPAPGGDGVGGGAQDPFADFGLGGGFTPTGAQGMFARQAFGPGSFESIADLLEPQNLGAAFTPALINQIGLGAAQGLELFDENIFPALREGLDTGFLTDVDPLVDRAIREATGNISQQFAGQTGSFSTDFLGQLGETQADIASQLRFQAEESAAGRRADLLPLGPMAAQARVGLPGQAAESALNLGEQFILDATRGGRAATLLQMLAGIQPTSAVPRGNISSGSSKQGNARVGF